MPKQKLTSDMMTVVRKSRVASIDGKQAKKESETPEKHFIGVIRYTHIYV